MRGDFHNLLNYSAGCFDIVFIVEALCHSTNKQTVFEQTKRVLRPNGLMIIADGYASNRHFSDEENLASALVAKGTMVQSFERYSDVLRQAQKAGLIISDQENITQFIIPSLRHLERTAQKLFQHQWLAKILVKILPKMFTANAISGYLLPTVVELDIAEYWITVLKNPSGMPAS